MYSMQTIRLQGEHVLLLFSVVHCTIQNLLTFIGKEEINNGKSNLLPNSSPVLCKGLSTSNTDYLEEITQCKYLCK